jgi:hypothetical protein
VFGAVASLKSPGFIELSDGRGGTNVEAVNYTAAMKFSKKRAGESVPRDALSGTARQLLGMPQHAKTSWLAGRRLRSMRMWM